MKPQSPHDDEFAFKSNIYLLIHQRSACERVVMENQSSDWHQLCSNIFRVCHCVQTLTQTLCVLSETGLPDPVIGSPGNWGLHTCKYVHTYTCNACTWNAVSELFLPLSVRAHRHVWYMDAYMCAFVVHVFVFMHSFSGWSGISVALSMGRVQLWKCLTFLSFSCLWKAGRCRERAVGRGKGHVQTQAK